MMVGTLPRRIRQRQPGSVILSVNDQRNRLTLLLINKKDNHLTITVIRSVMWAGTVGMSQAGHMQVERLHDAKPTIGQLLIDPNLSLFTGLIESQKGE
ncbi:MAG TPA: hypothetical protein VFR47_01725 [Anaerolineales bacterium]|nr:hypothetical protein [Anaerolineales bacterium]